jgi:23S rRNA maturation-related 3'-5' exoribonuclease YhaM
MDILVAGALLHDINKVLMFERIGENAFRKKGCISGKLLLFRVSK